MFLAIGGSSYWIGVSSHRSICGACRVVELVALGSGEGRVEDANEDHVVVPSPAQEMLVMLVKHIHVTLANGKDIAVHVLDLALSSDAVTGFEMIPVLQKRNGVSAHHGVADAKTHAVLIRQKAVASTIAPIDEVIGCFDVVQATHNHSVRLPGAG